MLSAFTTIALARAGDSNTEHANEYLCESSESGDGETTEESEETTQEADENNQKKPCAAATDIQLPEILWALMGISVTSSVASPLIKSAKEKRTKDKTGSYPNRSTPHKGEKWKARGAIAYRVEGKPKFSDIFMCEDPESIDIINMAKVQNFFFTMIAVTVYAASLWAAIRGASSISSLYQFPDLSEGLVAIIGISHAGYLVNKNVDTGPDPGD